MQLLNNLFTAENEIEIFLIAFTFTVCRHKIFDRFFGDR